MQFMWLSTGKRQKNLKMFVKKSDFKIFATKA